jgi:uncharacterized protein
MINIGQYTTLEVIKELSFGMYLDGGQFGEILLPLRYIPKGLAPGDEVEVFLYTDSEDRIIATTEKPYATVDEIAWLKCKEVSPIGAFLDWGLMKDLFVPFREQEERMVAGKYYVVKVFLDEASDRVIASSRIGRFINEENTDLVIAQEVNLLVYKVTNLGFKVVINNKYSGLLFKNEVFRPMQVGQKAKGYVKNIREDNKIDISLTKQGYANQIPEVVSDLETVIKSMAGFLPLTDNSSPEEIYQMLHISKKAFKRAVGNLYKDKKITLEKDGIRLI